jgi:MbtH protein
MDLLSALLVFLFGYPVRNKRNAPPVLSLIPLICGDNITIANNTEKRVKFAYVTDSPRWYFPMEVEGNTVAEIKPAYCDAKLVITTYAGKQSSVRAEVGQSFYLSWSSAEKKFLFMPSTENSFIHASFENGLDATIYKVVVNHEEQYSIWPASRENPLGWIDGGRIGPREECLSYIKEVWKDMRPISLRRKMEEMEKMRSGDNKNAPSEKEPVQKKP